MVQFRRRRVSSESFQPAGKECNSQSQARDRTCRTVVLMRCKENGAASATALSHDFTDTMHVFFRHHHQPLPSPPPAPSAFPSREPAQTSPFSGRRNPRRVTCGGRRDKGAVVVPPGGEQSGPSVGPAACFHRSVTCPPPHALIFHCICFNQDNRLKENLVASVSGGVTPRKKARPIYFFFSPHESLPPPRLLPLPVNPSICRQDVGCLGREVLGGVASKLL